MKRNIIIVTNDFSGLGWAVLAQRQGDNVIIAYKMKEDEEKQNEFECVGDGVIKKMDIDALMKTKPNAYWIFDSNHLSDYSEKLKKQGAKVFGASELQHKMENDRQFAVDIAKQSGLDTPETFEFSSIEEGLAFLEQNEETAYVFKPDGAEDSHLTYVPNNEEDEHANEELYCYMENMVEDPGTYVLQERVKGIEVNVEAWIYKGKPFFAFCDLENKRKLDGDLGENVGCGHDVAFTVPLESKLVKETVGKMFPYYKSIAYTGFADVNVIISEKEIYFLEVCNRFGYNSHPNLFTNLAKDTFANIMCDFMDGKVENFYDRFKYGFGATVSLYIDHPRSGLPIMMNQKIRDRFYAYDIYGDDYGRLFTAGYDNQVGIACGFDYTIKDAADEALETIHKIKIPNKAHRTDINKDLTENFPIRRYEALEAIKFI